MLYESVFVFSGQLSPKLAEDKFNETIEQITQAGGKILKKEKWGLRTLAYKIKKNSKGYYSVSYTHLTLPTTMLV